MKQIAGLVLLALSSNAVAGNLGDFAPATNICGKFTTYQPSTGAAFALAGTPALSVYKDSSTTQSTTGVTLTASFDAVTGLNHYCIDTSADGTFYSAGSNFDVVITTGTVDSVSVVGSVVGSFSLNKAAALRPATAGRTLTVSAAGASDANVTQFGGSNGTFASGRPEVNTSHIAGSAVSTSSAQIGVNVVNAGGTAWGSGAITAGSIATDAITAAKIAADAIGAAEIANAAIDAATFAAGAIDASAIATDAIGAAEIAADAIGASEIAANAIGAAEIADGAIDAATFATTAGAFYPLGIIDQGTAQAATSTTLQLRAAASFADDEIIGATCLITGGSAGVGQARTVTDYVSSTDTATVATWTTTPTGTITYECFGTASGGGSVSIAAGGITSSSFAAGAIDAAAIAADAIGASEIAADAIGASEIATDAIGAAELAASAIGSSEIADGAITSAEFGTGAITATVIATDAIGAAEIAADAGTEIGTATWASTTRLLTAGTNIVLAKGTGITGFNDLSAAQVNTEVDTALADIHLDHLLATDYDPASKPGVATALLNELVESDAGVSRFTANALEQAPTGTGDSASVIADAVWDELLSGHAISGSAGEALSNASSAGDPWATALPGAYGAGTAGNILGNRLDAAITTRSSQTSVDTIDNFVDTEIADIQSRLPAALVGGRMDSSTGAMAANVMTAAAAAADLTAELQSGLATSSAVSAIDTKLGTPAGASMSADTAAVKSDTAAILVDTAEIGVAGAGLTAVDDAVLAAIAALNNLSANQVRDLVIEDQGGGVSLGCALAVLLAYASGDIVTSGTTTTYEDPSGTETRTTGTVASAGNRTATITCPTY